VPQFDVAFDYLQLLDVTPQAVSELGIDALRDLIKRKKKEWTHQAINPLYQQEARVSLERVRAFEGLLDDPEALDAYLKHQQEGQAVKLAKQEGEVRKLIAVAAAGKKEISPRQRELIKKEIKAQKIPEDLLEITSRALGIKVAAASQAAAKAEVPRMGPVMDRVIFVEISNWLKVLDKQTLYDLLDMSERSSPSRLVAAAKVLHAKWSKVLPKTSECTAWEKTAQACITYLKDDEAKQRYDHALFNQRIDQFVQRIDLVLAGTAVGREEQFLLTRMGTEDFGFATKVVQECIAARAAEKGVIIEKPANISIQLRGQVQCRSCFTWTDYHLHKHCRNCGNPLQRRCENPACRASVPVNTRVCAKCNLRLSRGKQYANLIELADVMLNRGSAKAAVDACQLAGQILAGPPIDSRLARAEKIRLLTATIKEAVSRKAWTRVSKELPHLLKLAPRLQSSTIPDLEKITDYMAGIRERMSQVPLDAEPVEAARVYLTFLAQWTDCVEAYQKVRHICHILEGRKHYRLAWQLARKLIEIQPAEKDLPAHADMLEQKMRQAEAMQEQLAEARARYESAVKENRLYAAEKALQNLELLSEGKGLPEGVDAVRAKLLEVREEVNAIKQLESSLAERDPLIERYITLLGRCRDCKEALLALQNATPDPPAAPRGLAVELEGNRRVLSWEPPPLGKQPSAYVLERSLTRPGSRQEEPYKAVYTGLALHYTDDDIVHCGTIVRYAVHAVLRSRLEVEGDLLREFEAVSRPTHAPDLLLWQEVMNLRCVRLEQALQLSWYQPSAVRQVLIERWPGGPEERGEHPTTVPASGPGILVDSAVQANQVYTYRVAFVYDGPEGEFRTPGAVCTDALVPAAKPAQRAGA
jgi:hypothetical protein